MGLVFEVDSIGQHHDFDGVVVEATCLCPIYGDIPRQGNTPRTVINGVAHQVFRQQAMISNRDRMSSAYGGTSVADERRRVVEALFRDVHAHRAHSEYAVGPITDMRYCDGEKTVVVPDNQANTAYSQMTGI